MKDKAGLGKRILLALLIISVLIPAFAFAKAGPAVKAEPVVEAEPSVKVPEPLPTVGTEENLKKLLAEALKQGEYYLYGTEILQNGIAFDAAMPAAGKAKAEIKAGAAQASDYSTTNVQVEGVDEADIVKTDGRYIYQVNGSRIVIAEVIPADKMKISKIITLEDEEMQPIELYLDDKYLVVIGASGGSIPVYRPYNKALASKYDPYYRGGTVKLLIYGIENKDKIEKLREIELEGSYLSSRKIDSKLYLVANKPIYYRHMSGESGVNYTPSFRDTAIKEDFINIDYGKIAYFPDCIEPNYIIAAGVNLDAPKEGVNVSTYLGSGENIYASEQNLYAAVTKHNPIPLKDQNPIIYDSAVPKKTISKILDRETAVYRFAMKNGRLEYTGKGSVPGSILNQFSMDENNGYFRIATTKGEVWRSGDNTSKNNLYVLDSDLKICGKLEDIAPGERIYSVRFMGDRAYMVTFKKVDPLFVIDLSNAKEPKILGALKIPGYSDYLHLYDENHIIGFGKDTVEVVHKDRYGNPTGSSAYYLGMKMAIFDVSDVNNPKEEFKEVIGDRGTDSELLRDHKALLFSKEKNLLAFPITVSEVTGEKMYEDSGMPVHGSFVFQGAYVYNLDLKNGFRLKGKITHLSPDEYLKSGDRWYANEKNIERIIYIGDNLYTLSRSMIKANGINDMNVKGILQIP